MGNQPGNHAVDLVSSIPAPLQLDLGKDPCSFPQESFKAAGGHDHKTAGGFPQGW